MKTCYVIMPFARKYDVVYRIIYEAATAQHLQCARADRKNDIGQITTALVLDILKADLIIADVSDYNPNVLYELGFAHALDKPTILLTEAMTPKLELPFDLQQMAAVPYKLSQLNRKSGQEKLRDSISRCFKPEKAYPNPIAGALLANGIRLFRAQYEWLWGLEKTFREACSAEETWVIYKDVAYWEQYFTISRQTIEQRIRANSCKIYMLFPGAKDTVSKAEMFESQLQKIRPDFDHALKMLFLDKSDAFAFLINGICIYDPRTPKMRGIQLEPMAPTIGVDPADEEIEKEMLLKDSGTISGLKENYFDIEVPQKVLTELVYQFKSIWNTHAKRQKKGSDWLIQ